MTTGLLTRAAHANDERALADRLFRFSTALEIDVPATGFAKGDTGTIVRGVPIFKEGTFHGGTFTVDAIEIAAMVERFGALYPDVFVPPVRIDHGWSARDVIGWIVGLSTAVLADPSDGGREKTYLLADLELVDENAVAQIKARKLRNRSSELGGYETNSGAAYPLVVWGVAFVDIPAVEGLDVDGPIQLRAGDPGEIVNLTEGAPMDPEETPTDDVVEEPVEEVREGEPAPVADAVEEDAAVEEPVVDETPARVDLGEDVVDEPGPDDGEEETSSGTETGDAETPEEPSGDGGPTGTENLRVSPSERIAALRAAGFESEAVELEQLRHRELSGILERFTSRGAIVPANRGAATALLSHENPTIRAHATTILESIRPPVEPGRDLEPADRTDHSTGGGATRSGLTPGMTASEGGALWASLTSDQRKDPEIQAEYAAWRDALPPATR